MTVAGSWGISLGCRVMGHKSYTVKVAEQGHNPVKVKMKGRVDTHSQLQLQLQLQLQTVTNTHSYRSLCLSYAI